MKSSALSVRFSGGGSPSLGERGWSTGWLSYTSSGYHWLVSAPRNPYQRSKPRPLGQLRLVEARFISSSGQRCHLPTMYVFQPCSPRISEIVPFSGGIVPLALGKPIAASVMHAMLLRVWFRPVNKQERVGEHSAVVCHCVKRTPSPAIRSMFGVSPGPP